MTHFVQDHGYIQHRSTGGYMHTERVTIKPRSWPNAGEWQVFFEGRWRVVHVQVGRTFFVYQGEKITIQIEGV